MKRPPLKVPDVYMRRSAVASNSMQAAREQARVKAIASVRAVETLLMRVVAETGVLRGMPVLWGANDERGALRGVRFRSSVQTRGEKLRSGESAFVVSAAGVFAVATATTGNWVLVPILDSAIIAEDAPVAAALARDILDRHIRLLDERTAKLYELERWTSRLNDLLMETPKT